MSNYYQSDNSVVLGRILAMVSLVFMLAIGGLFWAYPGKAAAGSAVSSQSYKDLQ